MFTATKTVAADANGVLGYIAGISGAAAISAKSALLTTADYKVLATGTLPTAPLQMVRFLILFTTALPRK